MEKKIVITNISKDNENKKQYSGNYQYQYFYNNGNVDLSCLDLEEDYNLNSQLAAVEYNDGKCFGIHICDSESIVGNIYIGRVENVVKSLNCAFIEIKKGVTFFYSLDENKNHIFLNRKINSNVNIGDLLLIQISREPIKTKPATATCKISFTGQFLVLSSDVKGVTISGKTKNNANCKELKQELSNYISDNDNFGFILRTNSSQAEKEEVISEAKKFITQFNDIIEKAQYLKAFTLMYTPPKDYINIIKGIRTTSENPVEVITDIPEIYNDISSQINTKNYSLRLYEDEYPLYKLYSLESELESTLNKKVWLKSGGYLIIEQTEAMTVIDVNSGKQVSKKGSAEAKENAIFKTNIEAAFELARQLRLRNISGIVIVDFINMKDKEHDNELLSQLKSVFKDDPMNSNVVDITKLGLVEITRKKSGKSLIEAWNNREVGV